MTLEEGQRIDGKDLVGKRLATGGMGEVYRGIHERIGRPVAIKVLLPEVAQRDGMIERFEREAQVSALVGAEGVVDVLDLGELPSGERYLVMELLDGETLGELLLRRERLLEGEACELALSVLDTLARTHAVGVIHRDLKPDNLFLLKGKSFKSVKLLDFGVSKLLKEAQSATATQAGVLIGSISYMAPEQARGDIAAVDARSDLFALAVVLCEAVTGKIPHQAENAQAALFKVALEPTPPIASFASDVDPAFAALLDRALSFAPADRFQSAHEFHDALVQWRSHLDEPTRPLRLSSTPPLGAPAPRSLKRALSWVGVSMTSLLVGGGLSALMLPKAPSPIVRGVIASALVDIDEVSEERALPSQDECSSSSENGCGSLHAPRASMGMLSHREHGQARKSMAGSSHGSAHAGELEADSAARAEHEAGKGSSEPWAGGGASSAGHRSLPSATGSAVPAPGGKPPVGEAPSLASPAGNLASGTR